MPTGIRSAAALPPIPYPRRMFAGAPLQWHRPVRTGTPAERETSEVEDFPGLVVHGPLAAVLLARLVRQSSARPMQAFGFRGVAPLFDLGPVRLVGTPEGASVALQAQVPEDKVGLLATTTLG